MRIQNMEPIRLNASALQAMMNSSLRQEIFTIYEDIHKTMTQAWNEREYLVPCKIDRWANHRENRKKGFEADDHIYTVELERGELFARVIRLSQTHP